MPTISTTITVDNKGLVKMPPQPGLPPGEHQVVILVPDLATDSGADERARIATILREAGLLAELSDEEKALARQPRLSLDDARQILDRVPGRRLSDEILDQRGRK